MSSEKNKRPKIDKRTLMTRIVAWVLILMTVVTALYTAIYFLIEQISAEETDELNIAVGLVYGTGVDVAFTTTTTTGYTIGSEVIEKYKKSFTPIYTIGDKAKVTVLGDRNFGKTAFNSYYHTDTEVAVGGYHLELGEAYADLETLATAMTVIDTALSDSSVYSIPSYINGEYKIRIGSYADEASAAAALSTVSAILCGTAVKSETIAESETIADAESTAETAVDAESSNATEAVAAVEATADTANGTTAPIPPETVINVVSPSKSGVTVVEHTTAKILFEYDCGTESYLALEPVDNADGSEAYLATPAGNLYDGTFVYKRYISGSTDGVSLVNVVPLEDYIMGVVPYEISNSWPKESLESFAIIARTYVIDNMGKYWNTWGFNVDATTNTQVYKGIARANENVINAVMDTAGLVMTYNGSLAPVFYSSSVGNSNADVKYVWGGSSYPWLESVETPWEDYMNHSYAFWQSEVSPEELQKYLNGRGYTTLTSPIKSITVNSYAGDNSTYIYELTVTDEADHTVKITRSDKVRSAFSAYVKSSNFVVGKGSVDYTVYKELLPPESDPVTDTNEGSFSVLTNLGKLTSSFGKGVSVMTAGGAYNGYIPENGINVKTANSTGSIGNVSAHIETKTATASDSNNFIFVGKGWGHGVGYSQWGMYDLAQMGYDCNTILQAYCPSTEMVDYKTVINY